MSQKEMRNQDSYEGAWGVPGQVLTITSPHDRRTPSPTPRGGQFFYIVYNVLGRIYCILEPTLYVYPSDWLEGAEGPRQPGANARAPQGEMEGGRRPPSFEFRKYRIPLKYGDYIEILK